MSELYDSSIDVDEYREGYFGQSHYTDLPLSLWGKFLLSLDTVTGVVLLAFWTCRWSMATKKTGTAAVGAICSSLVGFFILLMLMRALEWTFGFHPQRFAEEFPSTAIVLSVLTIVLSAIACRLIHLFLLREVEVARREKDIQPGVKPTLMRWRRELSSP